MPGNGSIWERSNWVWSGADVKSGDLLHELEHAPFEADAEAKQGAVAHAQGQLENANPTAQELLQKSAGTQVAVDSAKRTLDAQLQSARPSPTSGVSDDDCQHPMCVPIAMRQVLELRDRFVDKGGFGGVDFLADRGSVARRANPKLRVTNECTEA